ncbi:MAG: hypothetical protein GX754_07385 [Clostridiaceae bacterium]|nr:hypothetical protein [Clostridiaceae bacterium]
MAERFMTSFIRGNKMDAVKSKYKYDYRHKKLGNTSLEQARNRYPYPGWVALFACLCLVLSIQILFTTGCSNQGDRSSQDNKSKEEMGQADKIPDSLKEMEENIEKIIVILDGPTVATFEGKGMTESQGSKNIEGATMGKKPGQQESQGKNESGDSSEGESNSNTGNEQDKQGSQDKENKQDKQDKQENEGKNSETGSGNNQEKQQGEGMNDNVQGADPWEEITSVINKMHYTWNSYLPEALKMGTSQNTIDDFSNTLNNLTNVILSRNKSNTLMAANSLYAYMPDLFASYKAGPLSEVKRLRYYARNAVLNSLAANWNQAEADAGNLASTWTVLKNMVNEEQQETRSKLDYSILELEKVIKEKNQPLSDIKGRIILSNIMELEESLPS